MMARRTGYIRVVVWGAAFAVMVAAVAWALRPAPVLVTTARVTRGALASTVSGEGRTRVKELYVISAPVDGRLERVTKKTGDPVKANDVIATITPAASRPLDARSRAEANASVTAAKAAVLRADATEEEARVAVEHADSQLATARTLVERKAVAPDEVLHLGHESHMRRSALDAAIAGSGQARAELARAQAVLATASSPGQATDVPSPVAGTILRVLRESAGPVAAGTPLVEVGDVTRLEIAADLLSSDAANVRAGAHATVTGWGGPSALEARVRTVDPAAFTKVSALGLEEQRVRTVLDLVDAPPPGLGHDYRVDVAVVVWEGRAVLRVPSTSLFRAGDRWAVFRVSGQHAHKALIELGATDGTQTVVTKGLGEGDEVITQPSDVIDEGTRVSPR
jgi:HlyD family secretion protein